MPEPKRRRGRSARPMPKPSDRKREKGRRADYRGATPEQVAAALLRNRPKGSLSG